MKDKVLEELLDKYKDHPDFLGMSLDTPNDKGAVDDTPLHIASRRGDVEDIILFIRCLMVGRITYWVTLV